MTYRTWRQFNSWAVLSVLLGFVLLVAGALKGYELATEVLPEDSLLRSRWMMMLAVEWEVFFALWLLGGFYQSYPRTTHWVALVYFCVLSGVAVDGVLAGRPSCGCLGKVSVKPWDAVVFDLFMVILLAAVMPKQSEPRACLKRHRWFGLAAVGSVFGIFSLITMGSYSMAGAIPELRKDRRLNRLVTIELAKPRTEDFLEIGSKASGVVLTVDEGLEWNQPDYGQWHLKGTRLWAVMEVLVHRQAIPARWRKVTDGYAMVPAVRFGKSRSFWIASAVLLSLSMMGLRSWDAAKGKMVPSPGEDEADTTSVTQR